MQAEQVNQSEPQIHDKDRGLFTRIEAALSEYERHKTESVPNYMERYQAELEAIEAHVASARNGHG